MSGRRGPKRMRPTIQSVMLIENKAMIASNTYAMFASFWLIWFYLDEFLQNLLKDSRTTVVERGDDLYTIGASQPELTHVVAAGDTANADDLKVRLVEFAQKLAVRVNLAERNRENSRYTAGHHLCSTRIHGIDAR